MFVEKFKGRSSIIETIPCKCNSKIVSTYDLEYDKNHIVRIVKTGEVNFYEKIQSYANDNDMARIIKNIELTENPFLYSSQQRGFIDGTVFPSDKTEFLKQQLQAENLKSDIEKSDYFKSKGVNFKEFIKLFSDKDYYEFLKSKYEKKEAKD